MREIFAEEIIEKVKNAAIKSNVELSKEMLTALKNGIKEEESDIGKEILSCLIENAEIAKRERIPICQDTGIVTIFVEIGQEVYIRGGSLYSALEEGIRKGYKEGYLRKSVCHPITRKNTNDNTPIITHIDIVPGSKLIIWIMPKGGGAENVSKLYMLLPTDTWNEIKAKILDTIKLAGASACPPIIVGIGIGGNFETAPLLAKKALLRPVGSRNNNLELDNIERELLRDINNTGIGPQGLGGRVTALAVHINTMPCHIASLPLAINIQCHANRWIKIEI